jgi:hypothetical protein
MLAIHAIDNRRRHGLGEGFVACVGKSSTVGERGQILSLGQGGSQVSFANSNGGGLGTKLISFA